MPYNDPIVNEIRKTREIILAKFGYDLNKFFKFIQEEENKNRDRLKNISVNKEKQGHTIKV